MDVDQRESKSLDDERTVLLDSAEEMREHARNNVMARLHGPGPSLVVEPAVLDEVPSREAILRAAEALRPERPVQPPRPEPVHLRRPVGPPRDEQGGRRCGCGCYGDVLHLLVSFQPVLDVL